MASPAANASSSTSTATACASPRHGLDAAGPSWPAAPGRSTIERSDVVRRGIRMLKRRVLVVGFVALLALAASAALSHGHGAASPTGRAGSLEAQEGDQLRTQRLPPPPPRRARGAAAAPAGPPR